MKLFALGALVPLAGLLLAGRLGVLALGDGRPGLRILALALAGFLLSLTGYGLLAFRSWPPPEGLPAGPAEAPELRQWLRVRSASWQGPAVDRVVLNAQGWGADLIGTPVLGLLGWTRHTWVLGLYPLLALSPREFEAVVSWEMVWWSDQQGWLNLQVKRLANHWQATWLLLGEAPAASWRRPFRWVWRSYAHFMVRQFEGFLVRECLWADFNVAQQFGAATYGRALCRLAILRPLMDRRILPDLLARLQGGEPLPESLYGHLAEALGRRPEAAEGILDLALDGLVAEAPALLRLRLVQLGVAPAVPLPPAAPVLRPLLEGSPLLPELEQALRDRLLAQRDTRAQRQAEADRRFRFLEATVSGHLPGHPSALEYLQLAFDRLSAEVFWDQLVAFYAGSPCHPDGKLLILRWTLRKGWLPQAEAQVEQILVHHPFLAPACHRLLAAYHREQGSLLKAECQWNLARRAEALLQRARRERGAANLRDSLKPHEGVSSTPSERAF